MARPNKVKTSRYRKKIDIWIIEGKGDTEIINLLKEQDPPEKIGRTTLYNYRKNDFNIKEEATKQYNEKKSQERFDDAVKKKVSEIEYCDDIIDAAAKIGIHVDSEQGITNLDIKKLGLQAVKVKHDITKDESPIVVEVKVGEMDDEEQKLTKEVADALARQGEDTEESEQEC